MSARLRAAVGGHSVWVYNKVSSTISEIDTRTDSVRTTNPVPGPPAECCGDFAGPVLAADASGAWFVSATGKPLLTHLLTGGRGKREYALDLTPTGVAVGYRAVWVVGRDEHDYQLLRIDPATGRVTARTTFPASSPIDSVAVGFGSVWVVGSADATLYRIDPRTAKPYGHVVVGHPPAGRPQLTNYVVDWVNVPHDHQARVDGQRVPGVSGLLRQWVQLPAERGRDRQRLRLGLVRRLADRERVPHVDRVGHTRRIAVVANLPVGGGPCLTSMSIGAGSAWVTVAPPDGYTCTR